MDIAVKILIGLAAGAVSAMGAGGGSLLLLYLSGPGGVPQNKAGGINLTFFVFSGSAAFAVHAKNKFIKYRTAIFAALSGGVLTFFASKLAGLFDQVLLKKYFALGILAYSIFEVFVLFVNIYRNHHKNDKKY